MRGIDKSPVSEGVKRHMVQIIRDNIVEPCRDLPSLSAVTTQRQFKFQKPCMGDRDFMPAGTYHSARVAGDEPVMYLVGEKMG